LSDACATERVFLDALGARRIPDPTTAGEFCRRFGPQDVHTLLDIINDVRKQAWADQPDAFFAQARINADGTLVGTTGECKQGMDIAYNGTWSVASSLRQICPFKQVGTRVGQFF
jgi:hypothetical protein